MFNKIAPFILIFILIISSAVTAEETAEEPIPSFIISDQDYISTRNSNQSDSPDEYDFYNGYYDPQSVTEPFDFRKDESAEINAYPDYESPQDIYSGYYNASTPEEYQFPGTENYQPVTNPGNAMELTENNILDGIDIANGGIPVWKETGNALVKINNVREQTVNIFLLTQQNNNIVGYNIEFPSNREDELAFSSFILKKATSDVILLKREGEEEKIFKTGTFTETEEPSENKKVMTFTYRDKEIKLEIFSDKKPDEVYNTQEIQPQELPPASNKPEDTQENTGPVPVFNDETESGNTVVEINF